MNERVNTQLFDPRPKAQTKKLRTSLLLWYDERGRTLPWRVRPEDRNAGVAVDPYAVWLSEIMCQQTTVAAVIPYWKKFLDNWPTVQDLANAPRSDILAAWAGLGYYARARNLHKCAGIIARDFSGIFPSTEAGLLKLPGIGPYTAAAIAAICYDEPTNVVDGNVERVISRLESVDTPLPQGKSELKVRASKIADKDRPGDYAQALMDLGATICRPKSPKCGLCPWGFACQSRGNDPETYPRRSPKRVRPQRFGNVFYLEHAGQVLLRVRPDKGLLGGMCELPGTDWTLDKWSFEDAVLHAPAQKNWEAIAGSVEHVFTHFGLSLTVYRAEGLPSETGEMFWAHIDRLSELALPSLMQKAIKHAQR